MKTSVSSKDTEEGDTLTRRGGGKGRSLVFTCLSDEEEREQPTTTLDSRNAEKEPTPADPDEGIATYNDSNGEGETLEVGCEVEVEADTTHHQLVDPTETKPVCPTSHTGGHEAEVFSVCARGQPLPKRRCCRSTTLCDSVFGAAPALASSFTLTTSSSSLLPAQSTPHIISLLDHIFNEEDLPHHEGE